LLAATGNCSRKNAAESEIEITSGRRRGATERRARRNNVGALVKYEASRTGVPGYRAARKKRARGLRRG
jgi:hypothetical protein